MLRRGGSVRTTRAASPCCLGATPWEEPMQPPQPKKLRAIPIRLIFVLLNFAAGALLGSSYCVYAQSSSVAPGASQPTILYGAAYYNEYMPAELQPGRLEKDIALMHAAGISVVRMGESTWSLWEPSDGHFEYAWMDRVVDA